ncbi:hypothetical protein KAR91_62950, partial [Candidatus Pacearchaeota archaeon]|nr:hypothetical protein [Candidatus Pacearchaeota archaeon]
IGNSIRSAYLGAAGNIQRRLYRQLLNYKTQSTASTLTKKLFAHLWEFYRVPMICIHDEIIISSGYEYLFPRIEKSVEKWVKENEKFIPTLEFKWKSIKTWAGKG